MSTWLYATFEKYSDLVNSFVNYFSFDLLSMIYMAALDEHQIIHSVEAFKNCNKEGLIRGILRNYSDEPKVPNKAYCNLI